MALMSCRMTSNETRDHLNACLLSYLAVTSGRHWSLVRTLVLIDCLLWRILTNGHNFLFESSIETNLWLILDFNVQIGEAGEGREKGPCLLTRVV